MITLATQAKWVAQLANQYEAMAAIGVVSQNQVDCYKALQREIRILGRLLRMVKPESVGQ